MLPNFIVIGAQKAGTSSLYRYLRSHPQIFMCEPKEPDYFVEERSWNLGRSWYEGLFEGTGHAVAVGEASTSYTMYPMYSGVPARIAELIPHVRLIYLMRQPVERMRSDYLHYRNLPEQARHRIQPERDPIETALLYNPQYLNGSRYALQIERYLEFFPKEHMLLLTTEGLRQSRQETVGSIYRFLGVDPDWIPPSLDEEYNRTSQRRVHRPAVRLLRQIPGYGQMARITPLALREAAKRRVGTKAVNTREGEISEDLRTRLEALLREDVRRLRNHLGQDFHGWGIA